MRTGSVFRRCGRCNSRVDGRGRRYDRCGDDSFTWGFVVDVTGKDAQGHLVGPRRQRKQFGFATRDAAQEALSKLQVERRAGTYVEPSRLTLSQYLDEWLVRVRGEVSDNTRRSYELAVKRLKPLIGERALQELTPTQVRGAYRRLEEEGRASRR